MAIWADIDEAYQLEFEKWHNCEHMADRMAIPGFCVGYRYQGIGSSPYSLMAYETADSGVLKSEPYLRSKNNPTPWTREAMSHFKNTSRMIYNLTETVGKEPSTQAPSLLVVRFNAQSEDVREAIKRIKEAYLSRVITLQGVSRARLYQVDEHLSKIITEEQKIYRGQETAYQRFLALIEISSAQFPETEVWRAAYADIRHRCTALRVMNNVSEGLYWLRFVMSALKST